MTHGVTKGAAEKPILELFQREGQEDLLTDWPWDGKESDDSQGVGLGDQKDGVTSKELGRPRVQQVLRAR